MMPELKELVEKTKLILDYPLLGSMPSGKQEAVRNGFSPVVGSLASAASEFLISFSLLFMLMNGVFTSYFTLSTGIVSSLTKALLFTAAVEGLYRMFLIISGKKSSAGSVFYSGLELLSKGVSRIFSGFDGITRFTKLTPEEKKKKEIADNFKKFIEYGMDQPGLTWEKQ